FGELHVTHARGEISEAHRSPGANRFDEVSLNAPAPDLVLRNRNLFLFLVLDRHDARAFAAAVDAIVRQVVVQGALSAEEPDSHSLTEGRDAAELINAAGAVGESCQHLHRVRSADGAADAAF